MGKREGRKDLEGQGEGQTCAGQVQGDPFGTQARHQRMNESLSLVWKQKPGSRPAFCPQFNHRETLGKSLLSPEAPTTLVLGSLRSHTAQIVLSIFSVLKRGAHREHHFHKFYKAYSKNLL